MKTSRRLIVLTAAAAAAAALTASMPAAMAAPDFAQGCSAPGLKFTVAQDNIHIRASPNGVFLYSIAKGQTFYTTSSDSNQRGAVCVTIKKFNGTYWDYGENASYPAEQGWVGVNYMHYDGIDNNG
jgi:hypothetical protein